MRILLGIWIGAIVMAVFFLGHNEVKTQALAAGAALIPNNEIDFWGAVKNGSIIWTIGDPSNIYDPKGNKIGTIGLDGSVYDMNHNLIIKGAGGLLTAK